MKTLVIESAKATLKNVRTNLTGGNKVYTSISRVLKDIQRSESMNAGYKQVFAAVGMPTDGSVVPAQFFAVCAPEQWVQTYNKRGEKVGEPAVGIWGTTQVVKDGVKQFKADGKTPIMEEVCRKVTSWTPNKVFTVLAQAQAFKAQA